MLEGRIQKLAEAAERLNLCPLDIYRVFPVQDGFILKVSIMQRLIFHRTDSNSYFFGHVTRGVSIERLKSSKENSREPDTAADLLWDSDKYQVKDAADVSLHDMLPKRSCSGRMETDPPARDWEVKTTTALTRGSRKRWWCTNCCARLRPHEFLVLNISRYNWSTLKDSFSIDAPRILPSLSPAHSLLR